MSGAPYAVLERLRAEGVHSTSRIVGIASTSGSSFSDIVVMYYAGGRKVLTSLLNFFTFDNKFGATINDVSETSHINTPLHVAMVVSGAYCSGTGVDGVLSGALSLCGASTQAYNTFGHATISNAETNMLGETGTVCAWVKLIPIGRAMTLYDYGRDEIGGNQYYITFGVGGDNTIGYTYKDFDLVAGAKYLTVSSVATVAYHTWTHIAVTSNGNEIKLYMNGDRVGVKQSGANVGQWYGDITTSGTWVRHFGVSKHSGVYSNYFSGFVDNFRLASYAMTQEQIQQLYESNM